MNGARCQCLCAAGNREAVDGRTGLSRGAANSPARAFGRPAGGRRATHRGGSRGPTGCAPGPSLLVVALGRVIRGIKRTAGGARRREMTERELQVLTRSGQADRQQRWLERGDDGLRLVAQGPDGEVPYTALDDGLVAHPTLA